VAAAAPADEVVLVEGFEAISAVRVSHGKLLAIRAGGGVTQGRQAAKVPSGARVHLRLAALDPARLPWLKIDTLTTQPLIHKLLLRFMAAEDTALYSVHLRPAKDTLWLPLTVAAGQFAQGWPKADVELILVNSGQADLIVDNVRLEPPARAPPGSVLLDFGPPGQGAWPGFQAAGAGHKSLNWSGQLAIQAPDRHYPDPLTADFVGPQPTNKASDSFVLSAPGKGPGVAWLWVTHYSALFRQAPQRVLKLRGRTVLHRRFSSRQLFGTDCVLEGMDGPWTPKWFAGVHARSFYDLVPLRLSREGSRIDLLNCQVAAAALAPSARRAALAAYVEQVEKDLLRFRRQFIVGRRVADICALAPTPAEAKGGVMVFQPPAGSAFVGGWAPAAADRAATVKALAANGSLVVIPLAIAATQKVSSVSASVEKLSADGRALATDRPGPAAWCVLRVARGTVRWFFGRGSWSGSCPDWIPTRSAGWRWWCPFPTPRSPASTAARSGSPSARPPPTCRSRSRWWTSDRGSGPLPPSALSSGPAA